MRGRTLNDSFIILDEAQNTTPEQMKMFLTRIGFGSKAVVTGDVTQTDLPAGKQSGLAQVIDILDGVDGRTDYVYGDEADDDLYVDRRTDYYDGGSGLDLFFDEHDLQF